MSARNPADRAMENPMRNRRSSLPSQVRIAGTTARIFWNLAGRGTAIGPSGESGTSPEGGGGDPPGALRSGGTTPAVPKIPTAPEGSGVLHPATDTGKDPTLP